MRSRAFYARFAIFLQFFDNFFHRSGQFSHMNSRIVQSPGNSRTRNTGNGQRPCNGTELSRALEPIRNLRDVARIMGISKSLVWNLEKQALQKIRVRILELTRADR